MACAQTAKSEEHKGRVKDVCKEFLMKADELYALKLQDEEYYEHYDKNRRKSQNIRSDLPVAKSIQDIEYQELLKRHQQLEEIEQQDALIALKIQRELIEEAKKENISQQMTDSELAKQLQDSELLKETSSAKISTVSEKKPELVAKKSLERTKSVPVQIPTKIDTGDASNKLGFKAQAENLRRISSIPMVSKYEVINEEDALGDEEDYIRRLKKEQEDLSLAKYLQEQEDKKIQIQNKIKAKSKELIEMNDEQIARALQEEEQTRYREYLKSQAEQKEFRRASTGELSSMSTSSNPASSAVPVMPVSPIQPIIKSPSTSSSSSSSSLSNTKSGHPPNSDDSNLVESKKQANSNLYVEASEFKSSSASSPSSSSPIRAHDNQNPIHLTRNTPRRLIPNDLATTHISNRINSKQSEKGTKQSSILVLPASYTKTELISSCVNCYRIDSSSNDYSLLNKPVFQSSSLLSSKNRPICFCDCNSRKAPKIGSAKSNENIFLGDFSTQQPAVGGSNTRNISETQLSLFYPNQSTSCTKMMAANSNNNHNYDELFLNNDEETDLKYEEDNLIGTVYSSSSSSLSSSSNKYRPCSTSSIIPPASIKTQTKIGTFNKSSYMGNSSVNQTEDKSSQLLINFSDDCSPVVSKSSQGSSNNFNLEAFNRTNNIVAAIDPTFTKYRNDSKSSKDEEFNQNLLLKLDQMTSPSLNDEINLITHKIKYKTNINCDYSSMDGDPASSDIFLPVQGQKRCDSSQKSNGPKPPSTKNKSNNRATSSSQCLQQ